MRVLFVASEVHPLAKTGGLADVSAALPATLVALGADVRIMMPGYPAALDAANGCRVVSQLPAVGGIGASRLVQARLPDTGGSIYLVDSPALFARAGGLYVNEYGQEWADNALRFGLLAHAAVALASGECDPTWTPDLIHGNDWHAGLIAPLLASRPGRRPPTVFTIHNLAFHGLFPAEMIGPLGLSAEMFTPSGMEFYGRMSFLKAAIRFSNRITTVSPTYASEILTPDYGCGLDGLLRERARDVLGILNGIDNDVWDPERDPHLPYHFSVRDLSGKRRCKTALQAELGLTVDPNMPLIAFVSRLTEQKMADLLAPVLSEIVARGAQFALMGQGDQTIEGTISAAARDYPGNVAIRIGYEEPVAHRLFAAADAILAPARFEPCGLTPVYGMRYGALPIARHTGGMADTVGAADHDGTALGFTFADPTADAMVACLDCALATYRQPLHWRKMQQAAMRRDWSWKTSARRYLRLYEETMESVGLSKDIDRLGATREARRRHASG